MLSLSVERKTTTFQSESNSGGTEEAVGVACTEQVNLMPSVSASRMSFRKSEPLGDGPGPKKLLKEFVIGRMMEMLHDLSKQDAKKRVVSPIFTR